MKNIIAAVAAGAVIFLWGFVSWTILPWHNTNVESFSDKTTVMQTLLSNGSEAGIYYIPEEGDEFDADTPIAFVNLLPNGHEVSMGGMMLKGLIGSMVMAYIAALILSKTSGLNFVQRVMFVGMLGLFAGFSGAFNYYNWFGFPGGYSLVNLIDSIVTWVLAGAVLAKLVPE